MPNLTLPTCASEQPVLESPRTASEVARELGQSITTVKKRAREIYAPIIKTASGIWIFPPAAVEKLKQEIARRTKEDAQ